MANRGGRDLEKEKHWRRIIAEFHQSGLSRAEFAKAKGIKVTTLDYWREEIIKRNRETANEARRKREGKASHSPSIFIPVAPREINVSTTASSQVMEIEFAGGKYMLRLDMNIDRETLRRIVTALVDIKC